MPPTLIASCKICRSAINDSRFNHQRFNEPCESQIHPPPANVAEECSTAAKGFRLKRSKLYRYASDAVDHGRQYAYRDRNIKKRTFRYLWQVRINAAARAAGLTYSRFMEGLKAAKCSLDRKVLADIAAHDAAAFTELVQRRQRRAQGQARRDSGKSVNLKFEIEQTGGLKRFARFAFVQKEFCKFC